MSDKPQSRGRGPWTERGVQAAQQAGIDANTQAIAEGTVLDADQANAIAALAALVQDMGARLDAVEAQGGTVPEPLPVDPEPQPTDENDPAEG